MLSTALCQLIVTRLIVIKITSTCTHKYIKVSDKTFNKWETLLSNFI